MDTDDPAEEWREIPGYEGYEASSLGRIRSLDRYLEFVGRWGPCVRFHRGRVLRVFNSNQSAGGTCLNLHLGKDRSIEVGRAILLAFFGEPPSDEHEAAHLDSDGANNSPGNLIWATRAEISEISIANGSTPVGERNHGHTIRAIDVPIIIERQAKGESAHALAKAYGITRRGTSRGYPGSVVRVDPGPDPTHTALGEIYEPPFPGYGPRGGDIDRNGVFWASLASGHLASFDRKKCKVLNGPTATGKHCPEGWTLYPFPGPQFKDVAESGSAEASYYTWVDQFDTFGLGKNVPIATGNMNDALLELVDGKFVVLRVPYPIGYFTKWMDGRIDDRNAGWKGKELWTTFSTRTVFHLETGKGTLPKVVRFQLRPDPLAH